MDIEVCIEALEEAQLAIRMGAKRVELCSALEVGGLTPSVGMIQACCELGKPEVHVLIRPRSGDFVYNQVELEIMNDDIERVAKCGASGVVFGVLDPTDELDISTNKELIDCTKSLGLEATFHRAIDVSKDPLKALDELINLGFSRVLTSGQKSNAIDGIDLIKQMVERSAGRIQIMAGSGVSAENAAELAGTGIDALHFSARKKLKAENLGMGHSFEPDVEKIEAIIKSMNK